MKICFYFFLFLPVGAAAYFAGMDNRNNPGNKVFISPCGIGTVVQSDAACDCIISRCPAMFRDTRTNQLVDISGANITYDFQRARTECIIQAQRVCIGRRELNRGNVTWGHYGW